MISETKEQKVVMKMFDFFRKKRISRYVQGVSNYIRANFKPEPPVDRPARVRYSFPKVPPETKAREGKEPEIRYSISEAPKKEDSGNRYSTQETDIKYSDRGAVRHSDCYSMEDIPNSGDRFASASVKTFLSQSAAGSGLSRLASQLDNCLDLTFVDMVTRYINRNGWRDSRVYKAAQMDRRLFSKIMSDRNYKPSKDTALALIIALELTLKQANDLLSRAGYTLSHSNKRDVIIEYFIREGIHDLSDLNEVLYNLDQKIIGR